MPKLIKKLLFLVLCNAFVLLAHKSFAQMEPYQNTMSGPFTINQRDTLTDPKFAAGTAWNNTINKSVKSSVSLNVLDNVLIKDPFKYTVLVKIDYYTDPSVSTPTTVNTSLTVDYTPGQGAPYKGMDVYNIPGGAYKIIVTVTGVNLNGFLVPPANSVQLASRILVDRTSVFQPSAALATTFANATGKYLTATWNAQAGAQEYDVEWTTINSGNPNYTVITANATHTSNPDYPTLSTALANAFVNNASRITTDSNSYTISLNSTDSYLLFRIRQVQYDVTTGVRKAGVWDYTDYTTSAAPKYAIFPLTWTDNTMNWQYSAAFAEDGRKKEVISYFDGSLRSRQTVTINNSDNVALAQENVFDDFGRPVVSILPGTFKENGNAYLHYIPNFNLVSADTSYKYANIAGNPAQACEFNPRPMSTSSGASRYYSAQNDYLNTIPSNKFLPDAEGYPFSVTQYTNDNTGRIKSQGGVGLAFQPGKNGGAQLSKTTRYYYGKPEQWELDRMFGNDAGYAEHYLKNMVVDPNGQVSVSYLNASGKTVATALAGPNPASLDPLTSYGGSATTQNIHVLKPEQFTYNSSAMALSASTTYLATMPGADTLKYDIEKLIDYYPGGSFQICSNCYYLMTVKVTDDCSNVVATTSTPVQIGSLVSNCSDVIKYSGSIPVNIALPGEYNISITFAFDNNVIQSYTDNFISEGLKNGYIEQQFNYIKTHYLDNLDVSGCYSDCHTCSTLLGSQADFVQMLKDKMLALDIDVQSVAGSLFNDWAVAQYTTLKAKCTSMQASCPYDPCATTEKMMLADVSPGGQYALFNNIGTALEPEINVITQVGAGQTQPNWRIAFPVLAASNSEYQANAIILPDNTYIYPNSASFTPQLLVQYWKPEWAQRFLSYHPEKCKLDFCAAYSNYESWDMFLQEQVNTAANVASIPTGGAALTYNSTNAYDWLLNVDPFFKSGAPGSEFLGQAQTDIQQFSNTVAQIPLRTETPVPADHPVKSLSAFVDYMLYCYDPNDKNTDKWASCNIDPNSTCRVRDREWTSYRDYYMQLKAKYYDILRTRMCGSGACAIGKPTTIQLPSGCATPGEFSIGESNTTAPINGNKTLVISHGMGSLSQSTTVVLHYPSAVDNTSFPHTVTFNSGDSQQTITVPEDMPASGVTVTSVYCGAPPQTGTGNDPTYIVKVVDQVNPDANNDCNNTTFEGYRTTVTLVNSSGTPVNAVNDIKLTLGYYQTACTTGTQTYLTRDFYITAGTSSTTYPYVHNVSSYDVVCHYGYCTMALSCAVSLTGASTLQGVSTCSGYTVSNPQPPVDPCPAAYAGKTSRFPDMASTAHMLDGISDPSQITQPTEDAIKAQAKDICTANAVNWIKALTPGIEAAGKQSSVPALTQALINVCAAGADRDHPMGASSVIPNSGAGPYADFGAAIKSILLSGGQYTSTINPFLIESPGPYEVKQQAVPLTVGVSNSTICSKLATLTAEAGGTDLYSYLVTKYGDAMTLTAAEVTDLKNSCNNGCNYILAHDITLPVFLDPRNAGSVTAADYQAKRGVLLGLFNNLTTADENYGTILSNYMNQQLGFSLTYDDYVAFEALIAQGGSPVLYNKMPYKTIPVDPYDCIKNAVAKMVITAKADYDDYIDDLRQSFQASYINTCKLAQANANLKTTEQLYHYTLYYYDQADNLVRTIPPEGVSLIDPKYFYAVDKARDNDLLPVQYDGPTVNADKTTALTTLSATLSAAHGAVEMWMYNNGKPDINLHFVEVTPDKKYLFQLGVTASKLNVDIYPLSQTEATGINFLAPSGHYRADISSLPALTQFTHVVLQGPSLGTATDTPPQIYVNGVKVTTLVTASPPAATGFSVTATATSVTFPDDIATLKHMRLYTQNLLSAADIATNAANPFFNTVDNTYMAWYRFNMPAAGGPTTVDPTSTIETSTPDIFASHTLPTTYAYNSTNQVTTQNSPDGGTNSFWYDMLSRLVISQNDKQKNASPAAVSYTKYDTLGRIVEVGQKEGNGITLGSVGYLADATLTSFNNTTNGTNKQITHTWYDAPVPTVSGNTDGIATLTRQSNLRKRVAASTFRETQTDPVLRATYYDYDLDGNVKTLWQQIDGLYQNSTNTGLKRIDYEYDLISGKTNFVRYQDGQPDAFYYRYRYDAENRLTSAWTGTEALVDPTIGSALLPATAKQDAVYYYYQHGPLRRVELGGELNRVQGLDYAYTLQGWLKGVNSTSAAAGDDINGDGTGPTRLVPRDAFGYHLDYYGSATQLDYKPVSTAVHPFTTTMQTNGLLTSLYNGNIASGSMSIPQLSADWLEHIYKYDQLNRIKSAGTYHVAGAGQQPTFNSDYNELFTYDGNGNILTANRTGSGTGSATDNLIYTYNKDANGKLTNNRLNYLNGHAGVGNMGTDQTLNNYTYDQIGNLTADNQAATSNINWSVYGKILGFTQGTVGNVTYKYDAAGNRVSKTIGGLSTYYVRDAQGNTMAVYDNKDNAINWREQHLYGSSRLGIWTPDVAAINSATTNTAWYTTGKKEYELDNHLGNVMASVTDKRLQHQNGTSVDYFLADVATAQDYYAFGSQMPDRTYTNSPNSYYRYGFNGKENDNDIGKGTGNQQDYGMRIYDPRIAKFLSVDPINSHYPQLTPYQFASNSPISGTDQDGLEYYYSMNGNRGVKLGQIGSNTEVRLIDKSIPFAKAQEMFTTVHSGANDANTLNNVSKAVGISFEALNTKAMMMTVRFTEYGDDGILPYNGLHGFYTASQEKKGFRGVHTFSDYTKFPYKWTNPATGITGNSVAVGAYQIQGATYDYLKSPGQQDIFPKTQDLMFLKLVNGKNALSLLQGGDINGFALKLKGVWTSLPGGKQEGSILKHNPGLYQGTFEKFIGQELNNTSKIGSTNAEIDAALKSLNRPK
ncbi:RHS repeat-associated core domain-containing protein [Mucilaginibacter sp. Mucisp84]|uniref:RHS repeat-associated core domain-containing protein n=1 Tax=Mucilaginibacter sp. Mucisp84 TaxID=3243058 RepID=UPI0039A4CCA8